MLIYISFGFLAFCIIAWLCSIGSGALLAGKFKGLGIITGKRYDDIVKICGNPTSVVYMNGKICTWMSNTYSITLSFDENDICEGVNSETSI